MKLRSIGMPGYLNEMQAIIRPNNKRAYLRVDRNDIWCNKQAIISACEDINSAITKRYLGMGDLSFGKSEAEKAREERNYRKLEEIWREVVPRFSRKLNAQIDALNRVYERKIIPFENKDDEYQSKATRLYYRYTSYWESLRTDVRDGARFGLDAVRGAIAAVVDLAQGLVGLAVGVVQYTAAAVALAVTAPFEVRPKWAGEIFAGTNTAIGSILDDPMLVVEGCAQSVADTVESEGIGYAIGYVAGDVLGSKGLSKLAAVRKATVVEKVDDVGDVAKVGGEVAEGLGNFKSSGDFVGIKDLNDFRSRIPSEAIELTWREVPGGPREGFKFKWVDEQGIKWNVRAHSIDPNAPLGSNASQGWIYRVEAQSPSGKWYMDSQGNFHRPNVLNQNSPYYSEVIANNTHILLEGEENESFRVINCLKRGR